MGYRIDVEFEVPVMIPEENAQKCIDAINTLHKKNPLKQFKWVRAPEGGFETLDDALTEWRYPPKYYDNCYVLDEFSGEKLGDCGTLFEAIAPFVKCGVVTFHGESGDLWRYKFADGKLIRLEGKIDWEEI